MPNHPEMMARARGDPTAAEYCGYMRLDAAEWEYLVTAAASKLQQPGSTVGRGGGFWKRNWFVCSPATYGTQSSIEGLRFDCRRCLPEQRYGHLRSLRCWWTSYSRRARSNSEPWWISEFRVSGFCTRKCHQHSESTVIFLRFCLHCL